MLLESNFITQEADSVKLYISEESYLLNAIFKGKTTY